MAAGYGREDTVDYLLGKGANPLTEDNLGRTPRELAQEIVSRGLPNQGGVKVPRSQMEAVVKALLHAEEKWTEVSSIFPLHPCFPASSSSTLTVIACDCCENEGCRNEAGIVSGK